MSTNFIQLNRSKTEALLFGTPLQGQTSPRPHVSFDGQDIPFFSLVTNVGVMFDPQLIFDDRKKYSFAKPLSTISKISINSTAL